MMMILLVFNFFVFIYIFLLSNQAGSGNVICYVCIAVHGPVMHKASPIRLNALLSISVSPGPLQPWILIGRVARTRFK
jgi:hypothetical protein